MKKASWVLVAALVAGAPGLAGAQRQPKPLAGSHAVVKPALKVTMSGGRVTLLARRMPLRAVYERLSRANRQARVILDPEAWGPVDRAPLVTLYLKKTTWEQAMRAVLKPAKLRLQKTGATYLVSPIPEPEETEKRPAESQAAESAVRATAVARSAADRVTLSAKSSSIGEVLDALSRARPGTNFLIDAQTASQARPITAELHDVPFEDALRTVVTQAGLRVRKRGELYTITLQ